MVDSSPFTVTTMLLTAFACWIVYIRTKGNPDSNIPLVYYGVIIYYVIGWGEYTSLPPMLVYVSLALALVLRFEFMNKGFTKLISVLECCGIATIIYFNLSTIFGWT